VVCRPTPGLSARMDARSKAMNIGLATEVQHSGELSVRHVRRKARNLRRKPVIVDVGANSGDYATAALNIFGENARIICFEPSPEAFLRLTQRLSGHENVSCHNVGLSSSLGTKALYCDYPGSCVASLHPGHIPGTNIDLSRVEQVEVTTLDRFCGDCQIPQIDLLKLDAEGHELHILEGARSC